MNLLDPQTIGVALGVALAVLALVRGVKFLLTVAAVLVVVSVLAAAAPGLWDAARAAVPW